MGNECRSLVRTASDSEKKWSTSELAPFSPLFVSLEGLYQVVFSARPNLTQDDLQEIALAIEEFVDKWQSLSTHLGLGHPLKLHILAVHVLQFCVDHKCTPAMYGEQDGEMAHRRFKSLRDRFANMGRAGVAHTMKMFNAARF